MATSRTPSRTKSRESASLLTSPSPSARGGVPFLVASWAAPGTGLPLDTQEIGEKAAGLLRLPASWVPRFLVFTSRFADLVRSTGSSLYDTLLALPGGERALLDEMLATARDPERKRSSQLLIRSNAPTEGFSSRGEFQSFIIQPTLRSVADAIAGLFDSAGATRMCPILQPAVEPAILGHMSNERRLTDRLQRPLVEWLARTGGGPQQHYLTCKRHKWADTPLLATTEREVLARLRSAAAFLTKCCRRWHCEWVWDGRQVWIVQADEAPEVNAGEADEYLASCDASQPTFLPQSGILQHFRDVSTPSWRKLQRPRAFVRAQLPTADIFVLPGSAWLSSDPSTRERIRADLAQMVRYPVVARTDLSEDVPSQDILLPTSPPATDAEVLMRHMDTAAAWFASKGIPPENWAFLLAYLIPARASAMVHAYPNAQRVRVDALWGFPDGLLHFPHDSYYYDVSEGRISRQLGYKGLCLLPDGGGWISRSVGRHLDWQPTLSDDEARTLADWGLRLARELQSELQLMALTRIGGRRGVTACLPWHFTTWSVPPYTDSLRALPLSQAYEVISSYEDLERLRSGDVAATAPRSHGYLLRPTAQLLRDDDFLRAAASFAAQYRRPLYFEGSLLGHAYYVMTRVGAMVVPIADDEPPMPARVYRKLVRDRIPLIIAQAGGLARVRTVQRSLARPLLAQKLIEESFEVWKCDADALVEELSDVLDVVDALAMQAGITQDKLNACRERKEVERGGFEGLVYLEETSVRRLRIEPERQGRLPLLIQDVAPRMDRGLQRRQPSLVELLQDEKPVYLLRFEVPLVPPVDDRGPVRTVEEHVGGHLVQLRYSGSRLRISVRPAEAQPPEMAEPQLELFPMDQGSPE